MRKENEGKHGCQSRQHDRSRPLNSSFDDRTVVIQTARYILLDLLRQYKRVAHHYPGQADQAQDGVKAKGLMEGNSIGTTPTRPRGAVRITIAIVEKDLTCNMITICIAAIIVGKIFSECNVGLGCQRMLKRDIAPGKQLESEPTSTSHAVTNYTCKVSPPFRSRILRASSGDATSRPRPSMILRARR